MIYPKEQQEVQVLNDLLEQRQEQQELAILGGLCGKNSKRILGSTE
jgi:hypothetical protein